MSTTRTKTNRPQPLTDAQALASLRSTLCPACGRTKMQGMTMCSRDYYALPDDMRKALYHRLGKGYREAVTAALASLNVETPRLPEPVTKDK